MALHAAGVAMLLLAVVMLGMAAYLFGLSGVQEARSQALLYTRLRGELATEVAPVGPTTPGAPVAVLAIPAIGVRGLVVVEGATPEDLTLGPGLRPDGPLPGQPGVSEVYGRRATFGAPFARIASIRVGDEIYAVTGEGRSTYTVAAVASSRHVINDPVANRLVLLTASSPVIPSYYIQVDARLTSAAYGSPGVANAIDSSELPLAGDSTALVTAMLWGLALVAVAVAGTLGAARWSPWATYLAVVPLILAVLSNLYQSLSALLPNLY